MRVQREGVFAKVDGASKRTQQAMMFRGNLILGSCSVIAFSVRPLCSLGLCGGFVQPKSKSTMESQRTQSTHRGNRRLFHFRDDRLRKLGSLGRAADVARAHFPFLENFEHRILGSVRGFAFS